MQTTIYTHRIAGLTVRTEANARLSLLETELYELFRASDDMPPDIIQRLRKLSMASLTLPLPTGIELERLAGLVRYPEHLDGPIIRSPVVRARLQALLEQPEGVDILTAQHQVNIRDFSRNEIDIFYTEENGGYDQNLKGYFPDLQVAAGFRYILSSFITNFSAILIHSSGLIHGDKAAVFVAPDEGGKTTALSLSNGDQLLSDDQIILRREGGTIIAHATPMARMTSGPCQARLGGLFMLEKARRFRLVPIHPADLVRCLWSEHRNYTFFLPTPLKKVAFDILYEACHQAPVYRMYFPHNYVDMDAIDAVMAGA